MILLLLALLLASCPVNAENLFKAESFTLNNGMKAIAIENHRAPAVTHMVWYKTGSIDDPLGKSGIAHVLEHLMFKGTPAVPDGEFSKIVARNGGNENAFTSRDYTAYYQNIARDRLELVMFLESDRMKNLRFSLQDFAPELEVVKEERLMRTENNPAALLAERRNRLLWGEHAYARPIIGFKQELAALTMKDAQDFYNTHYAPDNAILIVAGDITAAKLKPLAEKYYGAVPPGRKARTKRVFTDSQPLKATLEMAHPLAKMQTVTRTYIVPSYLSEGKETAHAYAVLAEILGAADSGVLYKRLVDSQKASAVSVDYSGFALDKGTFSISAAVSPASTAEAIRAAIDRPVKIGEKALRQAKKRLVAGMEHLIDDPATTATTVGLAEILGLGIEELESFPAKINAVTLGDVQAAYETLTTKAPFATTVLTPETAP